ncbi:MAG TPA: CAP domain-containing protein [Ktedonobacterales bacterium]
MRRFMAIGFVIALVLLTAEMLVIYASAHPGYVLSPESSAQDVMTPISTQTGVATGVTATETSAVASGTPSVTPTTGPSIAVTATPPSDLVSRVIARTNSYRVANGCPALTVNPILMGTAQGHSEEMALHDYVAHTSADGTSPWDRIKAAGYNYRLVAENIAWGATSPEQVVDAWFFESPPNDAHRKNILNCGLHEIGVGYYYLANDPGNVTAHAYWTQDFGTRA